MSEEYDYDCDDYDDEEEEEESNRQGKMNDKNIVEHKCNCRYCTGSKKIDEWIIWLIIIMMVITVANILT